MDSLTLALWTFLIGAIGLFFFLHHRAHFWQRKGIPHLKPVPLIGNSAPYFLETKPFSEYISDLYNQFPDARYFGMMDFHTPIAVIRDPELIKEICVKNVEHFLDHHQFIDENVDPVTGKNLFSLKGERWKEVRNTLTPSFTTTKMKFMFELVEKCAQNFVAHFLESTEEKKIIETKDAFRRYTNDVIATVAFGISVDSLKNRDNEFYLKGKDATSLNKGLRFLKYMLYRLCPKFMKLIDEPYLPRSVIRFFKKIVRDTVVMRAEGKISRPDMIQIMLEARDKENGVNLTIDDIVGQAFVFLFAGVDFTSSVMCFVAHELAMNPEIQEKLRNEVDAVMENGNGKISYETLSKMKYLNMVVSETLRKYPPTPTGDRKCTRKFILPESTPDTCKCTIKPGTIIWIPIVGLHHDPKYFQDPEKFDPERFSDENKDKIHPYAYLPFGSGPRKCIANRFALMETKILFIYILQHFVLERSEKTVHPVKFRKGFFISAEGGSWVKFIKRSA